MPNNRQTATLDGRFYSVLLPTFYFNFSMRRNLSHVTNFSFYQIFCISGSKFAKVLFVKVSIPKAFEIMI